MVHGGSRFALLPSRQNDSLRANYRWAIRRINRRRKNKRQGGGGLMSLGRARRHEEVLDARTCESPEDICNHFRASRTLIEIQYTFGRAMYAYGNSRNEIYLTTRASLPLSLSLSSFPFSASTAKLEFARSVVPLLARKFFTNMHDCRDALVSRHINHVGAGIRGASLSALPYASRCPSYPAGILLCILTISTDTLPLSHGGQSYR